MEITVKNTDGRSEIYHVSDGTTLKSLLCNTLGVNSDKVTASINGMPIPADSLETLLVPNAEVRLSVRNYNSGCVR